MANQAYERSRYRIEIFEKEDRHCDVCGKFVRSAVAVSVAGEVNEGWYLCHGHARELGAAITNHVNHGKSSRWA